MLRSAVAELVPRNQNLKTLGGSHPPVPLAIIAIGINFIERRIKRRRPSIRHMRVVLSDPQALLPILNRIAQLRLFRTSTLLVLNQEFHSCLRAACFACSLH